MSCTGVAASWCPECGTCTCVSPDDTIDGRPAEELAEERWGWLQIRDAATGIVWRRWGIVESKLRHRGVTMLWEGHHWVDPACPLHGDDSKHAERPRDAVAPTLPPNEEQLCRAWDEVLPTLREDEA